MYSQQMAGTTSSRLHLVIAYIAILLTKPWHCSCFSSTTMKPPTPIREEHISTNLDLARPKPKNPWENLVELWNDPRPISSLIANDETNGEDVPYCVVSDEFEAVGGFRFQVLLYPRGILDKSTKSGEFPASAYIRYLPSRYGDEVDIAWKLRLVDGRTGKALPIGTSGGLPKSRYTWSSAMTFVSPNEAVESIGRVNDWGCSAWQSREVCDALDHLQAEVEISLFDSRTGESTFSWPPKGGVGAVIKAVGASESGRTFRAGEVIVPTSLNENDGVREMLERAGVFEGVDYRIMTLSDENGNAIFSTDSLSEEARPSARLAVRPVGWKAQKRMWDQRGFKEWPVEVNAGLLSSSSLTRFNIGAFLPRLAATFAQDTVAVLLGLVLALAPLPVALVGREFVSLYAIPSASMEPTLQRGDVLLVEKLPGSVDRAKRGDVVLFNPPPALRQIIRSSGKSPIGGQSLFVKRLVGMPGDTNIVMDGVTEEVSVGGDPAVGPDRNLCDDEPLKLIDRLLENGKGKNIAALGEDELYVLGDCKMVSVDSRVFGILPKENVVGKPLARIWPLQRFTIGSL